MDNKDRKKILKNLPFLTANTTNLPGVIVILISKRVLEPEERKRIIQSAEDSDKCIELYDLVTKKGPKAFKKLVLALRDTGNTHLAKKLQLPTPEASSDDSDDEVPVTQKCKSNKAKYDEDLLDKLKEMATTYSGNKKTKKVETPEDSDEDSISDFLSEDSDVYSSSSEDSDDDTDVVDTAFKTVEELMKSDEYRTDISSKLISFKQKNSKCGDDDTMVRAMIFTGIALNQPTSKFTEAQKKALGVINLSILALDKGREISKTAIDAMYKFGLPKFEVEDFPDVAKVFLDYISGGNRQDVEVSLEIVYGILCIDDGKLKAKKVIGDLGGIEIMLKLIQGEVNSSSGKTWSEPWGILVQLTDENKENCLRFLEADGLDIFSKYIEKYDDEEDGEDVTNALIAMSNLADVESLRKSMVTETLLQTLVDIVETSESDAFCMNSSMAIQTLAVLLSVPEKFWHIDDDGDYSRDEIQSIVRRCYNSWSPKVKTSCATSTFAPYLKQLQVTHTEECQLSAAWHILNYIKADGGRYKKLASKEGALDVITKTNESTCNAKVRQLTAALMSALKA